MNTLGNHALKTSLLKLAPGVSMLKTAFTEIMASVLTHSSIRASTDSVASALAIWRRSALVQSSFDASARLRKTNAPLIVTTCAQRP